MKVLQFVKTCFLFGLFFWLTAVVQADTLSLTSGNNATTTPNVATSITGFQIVGNAASTTPVKLHVTSGTLHVSTVSGVTMTGNDSDTINLSGTVANLNTALSSLTYTRGSTGSDTLEVALVNSDQIYFPDNGHVYQYVSSSSDWNTARTAAEALTAYGSSGYLVTITSSAENNFVKARLSGDAWVGASDATSEGDWKWVTGPEAGTSFWSGLANGSTVGGNYASWGSGEPNNAGNEDCGEEYVSNGTWNDLPCSGVSISGYVAEFGSISSPVTVVSKNVSIVTADVPAVTSLSPSTGTTSASPTANLVIGFSKTVTTNTGDILIKKTLDDSTVESIPVSGPLVTGGGSNTITINPSTTLDEGVQFYIIVPVTAFKDGSNNFYDGISATSTWTFTTADVTAPLISSVVATSTASTSATITWVTNEAASTKVVYSAGTSYGSTTSETDTSPRLTSHSTSVSNLIGCVSYNYKVVSSDASANYATSTSNSFTTPGCPGGVVSSSATTTSVTVSSAATSTLSDTGRTLTVSTPANFTATSSSIIIQIKAQDSIAVLGSIGKPSGLMSASGVVFDVTALVDNMTTLDSFNTPVTISYNYTDADVNGINESSLVMYHYHNGAWLALDACSVNTSANTITCTTPSFSTFAIFGTASVSGHVAMGSGGTYFGCKDPKARNYEEYAASKPELCKYETVKVPRDLQMNMTGDDVLLLQRFLNSQGYTLAAAGPGSSGSETIYFGTLTRSALIKFQSANQILPSAGYFGRITRFKIETLKLSGTWW